MNNEMERLRLEKEQEKLQIAQAAALAAIKEAPVLKCSKGNVSWVKQSIFKNMPDGQVIEQDVHFCLKCFKLFPYAGEVGNIPPDLLSDCTISNHKNIITLARKF